MVVIDIAAKFPKPGDYIYYVEDMFAGGKLFLGRVVCERNNKLYIKTGYEHEVIALYEPEFVIVPDEFIRSNYDENTIKELELNEEYYARF